ncbi:MAG: helix-turn-helix transcriptional regulator [Clostridia bacterium]|nr:helix-turn-helix transcriptional regulator [Clostridia bacterium]
MNERIEQLRKALHLSQDEMAKKIGLSRSGISNIENGTRVVQERHIRLILAAWPDISEEWLRNGTGPMFVGQAAELTYQYGFDEICKKAIEVFDGLDRDQQLAVLGFVNRWIEDLHKSHEALTREQKEKIDQQVEEYRAALVEQARQGSRPSESSSSAG